MSSRFVRVHTLKTVVALDVGGAGACSARPTPARRVPPRAARYPGLWWRGRPATAVPKATPSRNGVSSTATASVR